MALFLRIIISKASLIKEKIGVNEVEKARVLAIGAGKWFRKTHLNALANCETTEVELLGVADVKGGDEVTEFLCDVLEYSVAFLSLSGDSVADCELIREFVKDNNISCFIISSTPLTHEPYVQLALELSVDIICDKPILACQNQSSSSIPSSILTNGLDELRHFSKKINTRPHRCFNRNCYFFIPLRRRVQDLYTGVYNAIDSVFLEYDQEITHVNVIFNDGCYRLVSEYNMTGAHSYTSGIGLLAQTGYHWLDFVAYLLSKGYNDIERISTRVSYCNTVQDYIQGNEERKLASVLGSKIIEEPVDASALEAELDINIQFTIYSTKYSPCDITLSLQHSGCTNRTTPNYSRNDTHDEGRTDDCMINIQQGPLQSYLITFFANSGDKHPDGQAHVFHRLHPRIARDKLKEEKETYSVDLSKQRPVKDIVQDLLYITANRLISKDYTCLQLFNQELTAILYTSALLAKTTGNEVNYLMEERRFI